MSDSLYLLDGHAQIYRAYYAVTGLRSPTGEPTNATFNFVQMLLKLLQLRPTYVMLTMDAGTSGRDVIDAAYKAQRKPMPEDMPPQIDRILQIMETAGIPTFRQEGFEADDVLATLVRRTRTDPAHKNTKIYMCTKDKDLDQLIDDQAPGGGGACVMYDIQTAEEITPAALLAKKGYSPAQARDVLALTGDTVDNIPGIPGIPGVGPKTAVKWIAQFGTLDNLIAHQSELPGKVGQAFRDNLAILDNSRKLVELQFDVPIPPIAWSVARLQPEKFRALGPLFHELGFSGLPETLDKILASYRLGSDLPSSNSQRTPAPSATTLSTSPAGPNANPCPPICSPRSTLSTKSSNLPASSRPRSPPIPSEPCATSLAPKLDSSLAKWVDSHQAESNWSRTMSISHLLSELNEEQRTAATMGRQHALVLAGAGTGKTKTIIARAAYLISNGTPSHRIQILTFTRRAAAEIVERVRLHLGDIAQGLRASTFHTWCISLVRRAPPAFGCKDYSVIDEDDQLQLFKLVRGKKPSSQFLTAAQLKNVYSLARNTLKSLDFVLKTRHPDFYDMKPEIAKTMLAYEAKKRERRYLDYDDVLDVVAQQLSDSAKTCDWVASQYDHLLVDEMQDTNPLQWKLLDPLKSRVTLFCVGDDAQSIYGFRGADFRNVHSFGERVEDSVTLKLEMNYRSTQEVLDASNWLLSQSPLNYGKRLVSIRGLGRLPQLHTFLNEWEEGRWIAENLAERRAGGANWRDHMILVRSAFAGRAVESALLAKDIPYLFIGGTKLLESAHVRDVLSGLRIVANPNDEIAWMRFLTLWRGVGETTANHLIEALLVQATLDGCLEALKREPKIPPAARAVLEIIAKCRGDVGKAFSGAAQAMDEILGAIYRNQEWERRRRDFRLVEHIAQKHSSILAFLEEYILNPVHISEVGRADGNDAVTVITIHSAKGTERDVCYVVNVSPGAYPLAFAQGNEDEVEEERRVLYVALTRAKNELIVTRQGYSLWAVSMNAPPVRSPPKAAVTYFLDGVPDGLFAEHLHGPESRPPAGDAPQGNATISVGIKID